MIKKTKKNGLTTHFFTKLKIKIILLFYEQ